MKRLFLIITLITSGLWIGSVLADGGDPLPNSWQRSNPGGGGAFAAVGAGPTGIIIAASDLSGAYRSLDDGQTWDVIGSERGLGTTHVSSVGFDPDDGDILYLGTEAGIYRSQDAGATVQPVLANGYIEAVTIAASNPTIGYAAYHPFWNSSDGSIYKTTNRGLTWSQVSNATLPAGLRIIKLIVDFEDPNVIYLLAGEGRFACGPAVVYESADGGVNWTQIAVGVGQIMDMALDPNNPNKLYITTYGDVWDPGYDCVSDDPTGGWLYRGDFNGSWTWTQVTNPTNLEQLNSMIWIDSDDSTLRLIDIDFPELFESTNDGVTWTKISDRDDWDGGWATLLMYFTSFNGDAKTLGTSMEDGDTLLWIDDQFVYATFNDGRDFDPLHTRWQNDGWQSTGVDNIITFELAISPTNSDYIVTAMPDLGCFRTVNGGVSWLNCNDADYVGSWQGDGGNSMDVVFDPTETGVVWTTMAESILGSVHTLVRSSDYGATWDTVRAWGAGDVVSGLSVDPNSSAANRILYATVDGDVWRGNSNGTGWSRIFDCDGCRYTAIQQYGGATYLFAGGEAGLWRSINGGGSWQNVGGATMTGFGDEFWDKYWSGVHDIVIDPHDPDWVYAVVFGEDKGLYRSTNRGAAGSWQRILADNFMRNVAISPLNGDYIFTTSASAVYSGGYEAGSMGVLYTSSGTDASPVWQQANAGLAWPFAGSVTFDPNDGNKVWLGSPGTGYHHRDIGTPTEVAYLPIVMQNATLTTLMVQVAGGLGLMTIVGWYIFGRNQAPKQNS